IKRKIKRNVGVESFIKNLQIILSVQNGKGSTTANRYLNRLVDLQILNPEGEKKDGFIEGRKTNGRYMSLWAIKWAIYFTHN
ncbi:MAG TPA: hypothetical protein DCG85_03435, partial [Lachnospiraceae bacterium]|nr:hypothetical protein [Lachnospiraceae bacterium]